MLLYAKHTKTLFCMLINYRVQNLVMSGSYYIACGGGNITSRLLAKNPQDRACIRRLCRPIRSPLQDTLPRVCMLSLLA